MEQNGTKWNIYEDKDEDKDKDKDKDEDVVRKRKKRKKSAAFAATTELHYFSLHFLAIRSTFAIFA